MLLVEIHKPQIFELNFSRSFLQIIVEIDEKKLALTNRKLKSAVVDPSCAIPLVINVIFKLQFL